MKRILEALQGHPELEFRFKDGQLRLDIFNGQPVATWNLPVQRNARPDQGQLPKRSHPDAAADESKAAELRALNGQITDVLKALPKPEGWTAAVPDLEPRALYIIHHAPVQTWADLRKLAQERGITTRTMKRNS